MEDDGWTYGEREDVLALKKRPVAPANARTDVGIRHLGRTIAGKRREQAIAAEQEYREQRAAERVTSQGEREVQGPTCRPCRNMCRQCDSVRPVCGTCRERKIEYKCVYDEVSTKDPDTAAPSSPGGESLNASPPAASTNPSNPSYTPRLQTDASSMRGRPQNITQVIQPKGQGLKRGKKRKQAPYTDEDSAEGQPNKRNEVRSLSNH